MSGLVFGQTSNVTVDKNGKVKGPKVTDFTTGSTDLRVDGVNVVGGGSGPGGGSVPGGVSGDYQVNNAGVLGGNANLRLESGQVKTVAPNFIFKDGGDPTKQMNFSLANVDPGVTATVIVPPGVLNPVLVSPDVGFSGVFMTGITASGFPVLDTVDFGQLTGQLDLPTQTLMTNNKLLGRAGSGDGPVMEINIGTNLALDIPTRTLNATGSTSGITTIPIASSIYVDAVNGSNSTGIRGRLDKPFQTIFASTGGGGGSPGALSVATTGDVVYVGPGTFTENAGFTVPAGVSVIGAGGSNTLITSNLSDTTHSVLRWGANTLVSDLTVQCTGANSAPIGILGSDTAAAGALFIGVNTIGVVDGFKIDKAGTNGFTAVDCTTTSGSGSGTSDGVNSNFGTNTVLLENCQFNSTGSGAGASSPRGIVVSSGTVKVFNSQINIAAAGVVSGDNIGVKVISGTAEIHGLVITRDTSGGGVLADLQQTGGTLKKENVSRPDGAALAAQGVITELSRYASRDKNLSDMASMNASATNLLGGPGKGNIKVGDGATWNTLVVGSDTQVLTADATQTTGLKWGTGGGGGGVSATKQDVGDANATITGDVTVINLTTPLTAARVITLPLASTYSTLLPLVIEDPKAVESGLFTMSVARAGSDTINGGTANVVVLGENEAGGAVQLISDGVSKWTTISKGGGSRMTGFVDGATPVSGNVLKGNGTKFSSGALSGAELALADVTTNNASTSNHGFLKKLDGNSAHFMDGTGNWTTPAGAGIGTVTSVGLTGTANQITITGTSPITSSGTWTASIPSSAQLSVAKLTNLTTNGYVKTGSADGTLSIDTGTYLTSASFVTGTGFPHVTSGALDGAAIGETGTSTVVRSTTPTIIGPTFVQASNAALTNVVYGHRFTDTSPVSSGSLEKFTNAAETVDLWRIDMTGTLITGSIPEAKIVWVDPATTTVRVWDNTDHLPVNATLGGGLTYNHGSQQINTTNASASVSSVGLVGTANQITITGTSPITTSGSFTASIPASAQISIAKNTFLTNNGFVTTSGGDGTLASTKVIPTGAVVGDTDAQTLTNKRVTPRTHSTTSATSWTPDSDAYDVEIQTALAGACTINAPSGTKTEGQKLVLRIKDNNTAQTLSFATGSSGQYRFSTDMAAPTTTVLGKTFYLGFIWNATDSRWDNLAQQNNF